MHGRAQGEARETSYSRKKFEQRTSNESEWIHVQGAKKRGTEPNPIEGARGSQRKGCRKECRDKIVG